MAAHFTMRTYRVKQTFRYAEGIWLHRKMGHVERQHELSKSLSMYANVCNRSSFQSNSRRGLMK